MNGTSIRKVLSLLLVVTLIFQQGLLAQGISQLDLGPQTFRPLHLRYFSYDTLTDDFRLLLDKGDLKDIKLKQLKEEGRELLKYFLVGITLSDDNFWVNLRPDSEKEMISLVLARTDVGKVLLETDLQLKKDVARFTSPKTTEGREYWTKLYQKAEQIFKSENVTIPTLTRPWIVPGEVIIRETSDSAYIYKGMLKVMLEQDYLKNSTDYNFNDPRLKELNEYSAQLIREKIIPKLTMEINSSRRYASLRQVFFSLILSRWFKHKFAGKNGLYPNLINTGNLNGLTSQTTWTKSDYFKKYQKSFANGEYNLKEQLTTVSGPVIRTYFSGGVSLGQADLTIPNPNPASGVGTFNGGNPDITQALGKDMVVLGGTAAEEDGLPDLETKAWAEGFASQAGVKFTHDKILKDRIETAFKEGRAVDLITDLVTDYYPGQNKEFVAGVLYDDLFLLSLASKIAEAAPGEKGKELHAEVSRLLDLYNQSGDGKFRSELKRLLIDQTRFIGLNFGEDGNDPFLFNIGDITSEEHRAIIAHAGTFAYEGSQGVLGGPRTIYLTLGRISGYRNLGASGIEAFMELIAHEFTDLIAGKHVNESLPKLTSANLRVAEMYKEQAVKVVEGTNRGAKTYDTGKVYLEKYTVTGDLGIQEVIALKGSSKTHPDVPKGSRPINVMCVKADVGSIGGHGSVPSAMLEAVADYWANAAEEGKILDFFVTRCGDDISITVTHINGKDNPMMHKIAWDSFIQATVVSKDLSLYGAGQDLLADSFAGNIKGAGPGVAELEFIERPSEPIVILQGDKWAPGGFNEAIQWIYSDPNSAFVSLKPQQANNVKLGVIDFEANNKRGRWAILDPQKMKGLELVQAFKIIAADQTRYSFTTLEVDGQGDIAAVTASRLHNIAGEYTGKDDPMAIFRTQGNFPAEGLITAPFFTGNYKVFGWMMGSHKGYLLPVSLAEAKIGVQDGPPLLTAFGFNINNGRLVGFMDLMAANPAVRAIQGKVGEETARLLSSHNFFNQIEGAAPAEELAYQKGKKHTEEDIIPWQSFADANKEGAGEGASIASNPAGVGGIDFRVIPEITQPRGNLSGLNFSLPIISNLDDVNLDARLNQINNLFKAGIIASGERLKECIGASYQKGELNLYTGKIVASLLDICRLEEQQAVQTSNEVKEVMLILDSKI